MSFARAEFADADVAFLLVYASSATEPDDLAEAMSETFAGVSHAACSTAGEIGPQGIQEGSIVVIAFLKGDFCVTSGVVENLSQIAYEDIARAASCIRRAHEACARADLVERSSFAVSIIDGLSNREEFLVSAIHRELDGLPVLGGSSGDDLHFEKTWCIHDGRVMRDAAVILIFRTAHAFRTFQHANFDPTPIKLVVTDCDPVTRTVREFNAAPAAREYADCIGVETETLDPLRFASHPLVVKVGGEYYCRSIGNANADGSLTFFCAVANGVVLTVASPRDLVEGARQAFDDIRAELGVVDFVLGFDCVLRRLDAENRQVKHRLSDVYRQNSVIGFNTYGEQFGAMHLNQTFTGIAIGARTAN